MPNDSTIHRLHDMDTEEVSIVDRAANKRKFLVVKNEKGLNMPGAEVTQRADGSFTSAGQAAAAGTEVAKASASLTKDAQSTLASVLEDALSTLEDLQKQIDGAKIVDDETEMDASDLVSGLLDCSESIEDAVYAFAGMADPDGDAAPAADAAAAPAPGAPSPNPPISMAMGKRFEVRRAKRVLAKAEGHEVVSLVAKVGTKMKKERFTRFQQAVDLLSGVMAEIGPTFRDVVKAKGKKPPVPAAGATPAGPQAANPPPGAMAPGGAPPGKKVGKGEDVTLDPKVAALVKTLETQVVELRERLGKAHTTIAKARGEVQPSNAAPVNGGEAQEDEFVWPQDMNRRMPKKGEDDYFG